MKKSWIFVVNLVLVVLAGCMLAGCYGGNANSKEQDAVLRQQEVYNTTQSVPFFEWSLQRQLWIDFYESQNSAVSTWSYITPQGDGRVLFETPSMGYPIPMDTQLTNPTQISAWGYGLNAASRNWAEGVIQQAEPNGLFTSPNTDATVIMATNDDGTVSPVYTENKVTCFPFPVKLVDGRWVRVKEVEPSIKLKPQNSKPSP